jgi:hypothetical protein
MLLEIDHDRVQHLFHRLNMNLLLLEGEEDFQIRQSILDSLLEDAESPVKELARILRVDI